MCREWPQKNISQEDSYEKEAEGELKNPIQNETKKQLAKLQAMKMPTVYLEDRVHRKILKSAGIRKKNIIQKTRFSKENTLNRKIMPTW